VHSHFGFWLAQAHRHISTTCGHVGSSTSSRGGYGTNKGKESHSEDSAVVTRDERHRAFADAATAIVLLPSV